jgi:glycosyltransferase involved in cell wall biosynthesis
MTLSAVIIVRNAAFSIGPCLKSLEFADEIVVVDSGSTDQTPELAKAAGARVIQHAWLGYGPQKRFAVAQASNEWVLCIDADERVSTSLRESLVKALEAPAYRAYDMARCNRFMGAWLRHGEGYPDRILRLFDRRVAGWSDDLVHEKVVTNERVGCLEGDLLHDSAESLHAYLEKQNVYTTLQAQALFTQGKRASAAKLLLSPLYRFVKFYVLRGGFLDGVPGLVHVAIGCFNSFSKTAKLSALWREAGRNPPARGG